MKNLSSKAKSGVILECGVNYLSDLEFVKERVITTIVKNFDLFEIKDNVIFLYHEFGESSINFETRFWINSTSALEVLKAKTEAISVIKKAFDKNNITIPFTIRTLDFPKDFQNSERKSKSE